MAKVEEAVMAWAAEHPEPVYPTWGEYLHALHNEPSSHELSKPIPADIAKKLGIEPKEGKSKKRTKDMVCGNDYCELE